MDAPIDTLPPAAVPASCAVAVTDCQDTGAGPDLGWLALPAVVLVVVVISVIVSFARRDGRGL